MRITEKIIRELDYEARAKTQIHSGQASQHIMSPQSAYIWLVGEWRFEVWSGLKRDKTLRPGGDRGWDFVASNGLTIDVKTAEKAAHLLVKVGHIKADIYVLAEYIPKRQDAVLIGWAWASEINTVRSSTFIKGGPLNHWIPAYELRGLPPLKEHL